MAATSKAELAAQAGRLRKSLGRAKAKHTALTKSLAEALERQAATAEILKVISGSPADVQPVFEAIARNALTLCGSSFANVFRYDGELMHYAASHQVAPEQVELVKRGFPAPPDKGRVAGRAILSKSVVCIEDALADPDYDRPVAVGAGWRRMFAAPMLREGEPLGAIAVGWTEPGPVSEVQQQLLKTFADQAVIAIENVRLFNETKEALERQTATGEILSSISGSITDTKPVFDAIVRNLLRLFGTRFAAVGLLRDGQLEVAGIEGEHGYEKLAERFPVPLDERTIVGRVALAGRVMQFSPLVGNPAVPPASEQFAREFRFNSQIAAPMIREGKTIGVIATAHRDAVPFNDKQVALIKAFADQAVIAIENVRLFNETKEALERQTATAEILKVISGSPTDVQPVFDAIVKSAVQLVGGFSAAVTRLIGDTLHLAAFTSTSESGDDALKTWFPMPSSRGLFGKTIRTKAPTCCSDTETEPDADLSGLRELARTRGFRSVVTVPLIREGEVIGTISVTRREPGPFNAHQLELLQTFADQAVIAIENVRLFKELEARTEALGKSVRQLTALGEVGQAISSSLELETVLRTIVSRALQLTGLDAGEIFEYDERTEQFHLRAAENLDDEIVEALRKTPMRKGEGAVGRSAVTGEPTEIPEILDASYQSRVRELLVASGLRALLAVPLLREDRIIGAIVVNRKTPGPFAPETVELLKTFATQSALAIQNARLFREIAEKSRQLELASRHKSDFLASMSHELRTPLNAILGFNEMLLGQVYGDVPADMQAPLAQMQTSGKHLLRLINNVLDLAKIEAGRMELSMQDYSVQDTVESVRSTLRPLATAKGLEFVATVPADIPLAFGDPGRIAQCLTNLAGNSLKFTKSGKVEISVEQRDGLLRYCVADTGIGIAPDKLETVFAEFKQTDAAIASEYGGTGLGLSISRKFVEMHGGRIWAESEIGKGSTFIFEIPLRAGAGVRA